MYLSAFPDASHSDIIKMLDRRGVAIHSNTTHVHDLCGMEEVSDSFDRGFTEQLQSELKEARNQEKDFADFSAELVKYKACLFLVRQPLQCVFLFASRPAPTMYSSFLAHPPLQVTHASRVCFLLRLRFCFSQLLNAKAGS